MLKMRRKTDHKKYFILSGIAFIAIFMSMGYSLLNQTLSIEAEANLYASKKYLWYHIIDNYSSDVGGYFYKNQYENGKYSYLGNTDNNYINLDGELWRIISIESDHTIKVVKWNDSIVREFDETGNRTSSSSYCTELQYGCNAWSYNSVLNNNTIVGDVKSNSTLLNYLNNDFYNSLSDDLKSKIVIHDFYVGAISVGSSFSSALSQEQETIWNGHIGIPSLTDILYPSGISDELIGTGYENNYLLDFASNKMLWTINPVGDSSSQVWVINYDKTQSGKSANALTETIDNNTYNYIALPTMYLKDTVRYSSGNGTLSTPFVLE